MASRRSPALPAFSYAQAAKGIAPAIPASKSTEPKNEPVQLSDSKSSVTDSELTNTTVLNKLDGNTEESTQKTFIENGVEDHARASIEPKEETENKEAAQPPSGSTSISSLKETENTGANGIADLHDEKDSQTSSPDNSNQTKEDTKNKDTDDDWEKVSAPSVSLEKELKAAPIPAVNIWQQRKEAQSAKLKAMAAQKGAAAPAASRRKDIQASNGTGKVTSKTRGLGITDDSESKDRKKSLDTGKPGQGKLSRTVRPNGDRDAPNGVALPPVGDATLWPTPESAVTEDKKSNAVEKAEKADEIETRSTAAKTHTKEKWVKVDHVPSVKWEYYTPPASSRRGGRSARGGRETGGRGGHVNNNDRTEKAGAMGPPAIPRPQRQEDRGRIDTPNESVGSDSVAVSGSRSSSVVTGTTDNTKSQETPKAAPAQGQVAEVKAVANAAGQEPSSSGKGETANASRARSNSKASNRFNPGSGYKGSNYDPARAAGHHNDTHTHPRMSAADRRSMPPDFYSQGDVFGQRGDGKGRDFGRDKGDSLRDSSVNWRDRDNQNDRPERREPRMDRGRGGYRGRGNHNGYGSHNAQGQSWTNPLPQHSFPSKSHSFNERHRQSSAPFSGQVQHQNQRVNHRTQSIHTNGYSNVNGVAQQPLSPNHQDFPMFYPMSQSMPYGIDYNIANTMRMVQAQIEYYFSIENLCKDMYLRRHMDSQGYVLFTFITSFKRLRQLTDDLNIIRETCAQIPTVDYVRGEDGQERLRRHEGWGQWTLSIDDRDESARNMGPVSVTPAVYLFPQMYGQNFSMTPNHDMNIPPWMNGNAAAQFSGSAYGFGRNEYDFQPVGASMNGTLHTPSGSEQHNEKQGAFLTEQRPNGVSPATVEPSSANEAISKPYGVADNAVSNKHTERSVAAPKEILEADKMASVVSEVRAPESSLSTATVPSQHGGMNESEQ